MPDEQSPPGRPRPTAATPPPPASASASTSADTDIDVHAGAGIDADIGANTGIDPGADTDADTDADTTRRGVSPVVGAVLAVLLAAALAGVVAVGFHGTVTDADGPPARVAFDLTVRADGTVVLVHRGGDRLDVRDLRVRVSVDGRPLARQPPVPFFSAPGFVSEATGPFNPADDPGWTAGERASFRIATTNSPTVSAGRRVAVSVFVDGHRVWRDGAVAG